MSVGNKVPEERVLSYIESVYRFCSRRCYVRQDAEDLAQEILLELLKGIRSGVMDENFEGWVWTVARNRYARLVHRTSRSRDILQRDWPRQANTAAASQVEVIIAEEEQRRVFTELSRLSALYREIVRMFYIEGKAQSEIAATLDIPVGTVKRRLLEGRQRLRKGMDTMAQTTNDTSRHIDLAMANNGSMDPSRYLGRQIRRAIVMSTYEQAKTVEEISRDIEVPAVIIEDEMEELIYGEAISKKRDRYATNCIILRKEDDRSIVTALRPFVGKLARTLCDELAANEDRVRGTGFYGHDFGWEHLLWTLVPMSVRSLTSRSRSRNSILKTPPYPPRQDGGHGWFAISERSETSRYGAGANGYYAKDSGFVAQYYWMGNYAGNDLDSILSHVAANADCAELVRALVRGDAIDEKGEELPFLVEKGMVMKLNGSYNLQTLAFTKPQADRLHEALEGVCDSLVDDMEKLALEVHEGFLRVVPERLHGQIGGYLGGYLHKVIGMVTEEYVRDGVLDSPYIGDEPYKQVTITIE
jgi:RNA polymerase sigma factor (sigma-70 family)